MSTELLFVIKALIILIPVAIKWHEVRSEKTVRSCRADLEKIRTDIEISEDHRGLAVETGLSTKNGDAIQSAREIERKLQSKLEKAVQAEMRNSRNTLVGLAISAVLMIVLTGVATNSAKSNANTLKQLAEDIPDFKMFRKSVAEINRLDTSSRDHWYGGERQMSAESVDEMVSVIANFESSIGIGSVLSPLLVNYAYRYSDNGDYDGAVSLLELAADLSPQSIVVMRDIANVLTDNAAASDNEIRTASNIFHNLIGEPHILPSLRRTVLYGAFRNAIVTESRGLNQVLESPRELLAEAIQLLDHEPEHNQKYLLPTYRSELATFDFNRDGNSLEDREDALRRHRRILETISPERNPIMYYDIVANYSVNTINYYFESAPPDVSNPELALLACDPLAELLELLVADQERLTPYAGNRLRGLASTLLVILETRGLDGLGARALANALSRYSRVDQSVAAADPSLAYTSLMSYLDNPQMSKHDRLDHIPELLEMTEAVGGGLNARQYILVFNFLEQLAIMCYADNGMFENAWAEQILKEIVLYYCDAVSDKSNPDFVRIREHFNSRVCERVNRSEG